MTASDVQPGIEPGIREPCAWCGGPIPRAARRDAVCCSKRCRQARHRFGSSCVARARATSPLRFGYADPPYPGLAARYYSDHPDYGGEVDHRELVARMAADFDGWALSTSSDALPDLLAMIRRDLGLEVRVGSWHRGSRPGVTAWPRKAWEPVVYAGGRRVPSREACDDAFTYRARPRTTDPGRIIGMKPAPFCYWIFDLLGARPGDVFVDLFAGSGGVARAWEVYESRAPDASRRVSLEQDATAAQGDASPEYLRDASRLEPRRVVEDLRDASAGAGETRRIEPPTTGARA